MADNDIRKLLNYIITHPIADIQATTEELSASPLEPGEQVATNVAHEVQTEQEAANRMHDDFAAGLRAAGATRANGGALTLDDTDAAQDAMASALVRFLVSPDLASVETTELEGGHYRYAITVNWAALESAAQQAGVDLNAALS